MDLPNGDTMRHVKAYLISYDFRKVELFVDPAMAMSSVLRVAGERRSYCNIIYCGPFIGFYSDSIYDMEYKYVHMFNTDYKSGN